jgi:NAD(P)-dependent dehydrogenase (short-subunit alcohol dehydrogenase family)
MLRIMPNLNGKVAVITGGSSGIGLATALLLAKNGVLIAIGARGAERGQAVVREVEAAGGTAIFVPADMAKPDDIRRLITRTVDTFGRLDYAFNNAASEAGILQYTHELSEHDFDLSVAVNLKGVWLCMKHEIEQMLKQEPRGGSIVNTSSVNGLGGARQGSVYSATKAGVLGLTKSAALEYAQQGIRVNALVAGGFKTPMLEGIMDRVSTGKPEARAAIEEKYKQLVALGRIGDPPEAAEAAMWLLSDAASYVTGFSMIVDGGMTAGVR